MVQLLLSKGANLEFQEESGKRPLHYAVAGNHTEVIEELS